MRNALLAVGLISGLAGCSRGAPMPPSPGVALVANATASGLPTIVEFGAKNCVSCREMEGILDSVAKKTAGKAHVLVIDISKDYEAAKVFQIRLMPTQVFFDAQGREIGRHLGKLPEAEVMAGLGFGS
ncbi:MAG: thioredoxin family protein [Rhodocyclaceae bacterium]